VKTTKALRNETRLPASKHELILKRSFLCLLKIFHDCALLEWRKQEDECKTGVLVKTVTARSTRIVGKRLAVHRLVTKTLFVFSFLSLTPIVKCKTSEEEITVYR
jgi:hypothetical protein